MEAKNCQAKLTDGIAEMVKTRESQIPTLWTAPSRARRGRTLPVVASMKANCAISSRQQLPALPKLSCICCKETAIANLSPED